MHIANISIDFPVLHLDSTVRYCTPRQPALFENALLNLYTSFSDNPEYNGAPLEQMFRRILCVPDSNDLVGPSLAELIALGVFRCSVPYNSRLESVALRDLSMTPAGEEMYREGLLPGRPQHRRVSHLYDPISGKLLLNGKEPHLLEEAGTFHVDYRHLLGVYPKRLIMDSVPTENHHWWNGCSRVLDCRLDEHSVRWRRREGGVLLTEDGSIRFELGASADSEYVNQLESVTLVERFLRPLLLTENDLKWLPLLKPDDIKDVFQTAVEFFPVHAVPERMHLTENGVHIVRNDTGLVDMPNTPQSGKVVVFVDPSQVASPNRVRWNEDKTGAFVYLNERLLPGGCMYVGTDGTNVFANIFDLCVAQTVHKTPLGYAWKGSYVAAFS